MKFFKGTVVVRSPCFISGSIVRINSANSVLDLFSKISVLVIFILNYSSVRIFLPYCSVIVIVIINCVVSVVICINCFFIWKIISKGFGKPFFVYCLGCKSFTVKRFFTIYKLNLSAVTFCKYIHSAFKIISHLNFIAICVYKSFAKRICYF